MRNVPFITLIVLIFSACEKDISVNLPQQQQQLVVEGKFESGTYPQVILTHSLNYFAKIDPVILLNSFVHNATVTVSDGSKTMTLTEQTIDTGGVQFFVYRPDPNQIASAFKGKLSGIYTLRINADNKAYESVTTIPLNSFKLDSVWWHRVQVKSDTNKARLWARITDPPAFGNYARYFTKRNSEPFLPGLNSVINDEVVNGTTFEIPVDAGVNKNKSIDLETYAFFNSGDTVTLKFCNIDKATYDFWRTLDFAYNSNGNPFSSPTKILGNIPGALGYWGGYAVTYKTIIISK
ncbi:uncharacterized protein DUF4249 [Chitinophaga niastensis]|uniref:Uncharacterized protein DUF4249 n=1 Tax=Chitinophaga niastensis TaxID=536980 RepID=A0A2P8HPH9_CHINA|nr:DUF4249 domain-containing protein [Chitinophaga niastensis]PSL48107.1 uncharacterized protein DUF4249 [Chitinophaga niastensis]